MDDVPGADGQFVTLVSGDGFEFILPRKVSREMRIVDSFLSVSTSIWARRLLRPFFASARSRVAASSACSADLVRTQSLFDWWECPSSLCTLTGDMWRLAGLFADGDNNEIVLRDISCVHRLRREPYHIVTG